MVMTSAKRTKRVLRWLLGLQQTDQYLAPSATPIIRYNLLHNPSRCVQVSVNIDETEATPCYLSYNALPKFIRSQLEAQKITDDTSLWQQVIPILNFIQSSLCRPGRPRGFPTLFLWYSKEKHRSFLFFAFVDVKMVSKKYTSRELLRMRSAPTKRDLYEQLYGKLQADLELSKSFPSVQFHIVYQFDN